MNTHADKMQENKSQSVANEVSQKQSGSESTFQFVDNRPEAVAQRKLQEMANNSLQVHQVAQLQAMADNNFVQRQHPIQKKENNTGLPDNLKSGIENLSGYSMDHVRVHRNSDKPSQLQAHAYAQGTEIHLGPGQEKHLPHEAWHVVQQKQGRVKPLLQMNGTVNVNDDLGLEKEADVMGAKASRFANSRPEKNGPKMLPIVEYGKFPEHEKSIQRTRIKGKDTQNNEHRQQLEVILAKSNDNALKRYSKEIARDNHANATHFLGLIQTELTERQLSSVEKHGPGANWANAAAYIDGAQVCSINDRANSNDVREGNEYEFVGKSEASTWGTEIGISSGDTEVSLLDEVDSRMTKRRLKKAKNEIFIRIASTNGACDGCKERLLLLKKKIRLKLGKSQSHIPIKVSYWYTTTPVPAIRQTIPTTYGWNGDAAGMFQYYNHDI